MAGSPRSLDDLSNKAADLIIACSACGHDRSITIDMVMNIFRRRRWSTDSHQAHRRFRCRKCGSKDVRVDADFYGRALRLQRRSGSLAAVPEMLKPGLQPPPPGVRLSDWNRASERERKNHAERARS